MCRHAQSSLIISFFLGYAYAFDKHNDSYLLDLNTPYDYESVLHYGPYSFNIHSNISSITTKIPKFNEIIGQRLDLSRIDSLELNKLYGCCKFIFLFPVF